MKKSISTLVLAKRQVNLPFKLGFVYVAYPASTKIEVRLKIYTYLFSSFFKDFTFTTHEKRPDFLANHHLSMSILHLEVKLFQLFMQ